MSENNYYICEMKKCTVCANEKDLSQFIKSKRSKSGYGAVCLSCNKKRGIKYRIENPEKVKLTQINATYPKSEKRKQYLKKWKIENKVKNNELRLVNHYKKMEDPIYKFKHNLRLTIVNSIRRHKYVKKTFTQNILGCGYSDFILHIEKQFEPWMNWDNYGGTPNSINDRWDIDHIKPSSLAKDEEEIKILNHYTNLRPLCSYTNRWIKSNKYNINGEKK
jgi:hypothetical protein